MRDGIAYITEDRKAEGFLETMSTARNIHLGALAKLRGKPLVSRQAAVAAGEHWIKTLKVRAIGKDVKVVELSSGNQQKVVIAKSEVMALSDRILVARQGKVVEEYSALEATEEKIMYAAIH